jgi:hypothetical protein
VYLFFTVFAVYFFRLLPRPSDVTDERIRAQIQKRSFPTNWNLNNKEATSESTSATSTQSLSSTSTSNSSDHAAAFEALSHSSELSSQPALSSLSDLSSSNLPCSLNSSTSSLSASSLSSDSSFSSLTLIVLEFDNNDELFAVTRSRPYVSPSFTFFAQTRSKTKKQMLSATTQLHSHNASMQRQRKLEHAIKIGLMKNQQQQQSKQIKRETDTNDLLVKK